MIKGYTDLVTVIRKQGWPSLKTLRGRFLFVLNGSTLRGYARTVGVNMMATDEIKDVEWAAVGNSPFVKTL